MPTPQIDPNPVDDRSEKNIQTLLLGLSWGGDWTSRKDEPHYELRPGWARDMSEDACSPNFAPARIPEKHCSRKPGIHFSAKYI